MNTEADLRKCSYFEAETALSLLVLQRQFLVMVDGDHGVGSGRFGLGAGGVAARSTS
jgi:hypothetical protein